MRFPGRGLWSKTYVSGCFVDAWRMITGVRLAALIFEYACGSRIPRTSGTAIGFDVLSWS